MPTRPVPPPVGYRMASGQLAVELLPELEAEGLLALGAVGLLERRDVEPAVVADNVRPTSLPASEIKPSTSSSSPPNVRTSSIIVRGASAGMAT